MKPLRPTPYAVVVAVLLILLAQLVAASPSQSAAFDEGYTITYGYAYLRGGDARLSRGQNPPLTNVFIALPLLLRADIVFPAESVNWTTPDIFGFTDEFLWQVNPDPQRLVLLARLPEMALALLLACVIFAFTRTVFDERAALAALFLCAFDPNLLAHGHIVGTDLGVTLFMFAAVWQWTIALRRNSFKRAMSVGVLTGAAFATKYSAVWLIPIAVGLSLIYPGVRRHFGRRLIMGLLVGLLALSVIWGTFAFSIGPLEPGGLWWPAPQYWQSLASVYTRVELSTPAFLLGQVSASGFPGYYPFAFLVKTPLPTLILLLVGGARLVARRRREDAAGWLPPLVFLLAAMFGGLNLGYRLMLPVLPFALMIAGQGVSVLATNASPRRVGVIAVLGGWLVVDVISINPHHLAYFNPLVNRARDYEALVDSNLDWGQDLIALREWQRSHPLDPLSVAYYGSARPAAYGLNVTLLPGFSLRDFGPEIDGFTAYALPPGWYAISVSSLQLGLLYSRSGLYAPFKQLQPVERVGRSFLIYHVTYPLNEIDRTVALGPFAGDLDRATLGASTDRQLIVKWAGEDAAVIDMQGAARYITRGGEPIVGFAPAAHDALIAHGARLGNDASGDLRLWQIDARAALSETLPSRENQPIFAPDHSALKLPIAFDGGLALIGYDLTDSSDQRIDLVTYWRVEHTPSESLAIFAQVLDARDRLIAQRDGLNVKLSALEPGDVILQHFVIELPAGATALAIGLYAPASGQRQRTDQKLDHVELIWN